jgi:hypothetical protein
MGTMQYPDGRWMEAVWTQGRLTEVLSKLSEAHLEAPLEERASKTYQARVSMRVVE